MPKALRQFLLMHREPLPSWLANFVPGSSFPLEDFLNSRTVFYPGSGTDGFPVKELGSSHAAHCFVYCDYLVEESKVRGELDHFKRGFRGYRSIAQIPLENSEILPKDFSVSERLERLRTAKWKPEGAALEKPAYAFAEILERDAEHDDSWGPVRLCLLFLGFDAMAASEALFYCAGKSKPPYAVLIHDHGVGGGYAQFGGRGFLYQKANDLDAFPKWLLVAQNSEPWPGFSPVPDVESSGDRTQRTLYRRDIES